MAGLDICSHSTGGKSLSNNKINIVLLVEQSKQINSITPNI